MSFSVSVQNEDFSLEKELNALEGKTGKGKSGAIVSFVGCVRADSPDMLALELEHYPEMCEKKILEHITLARKRWPLNFVRIIHRVGRLQIGEQIVLVLVGSEHRKTAFEASEFLMDFLKNEAPFWKKQINTENEVWLEAKESDLKALNRWKTKAIQVFF